MPFRAKLNVLKGVHYDSGDKFVNAAAHQKGPVACLTGGGANTGPFGGGNGNSSGYGNNISVDQYIASKWGVNTRLKTLELGVGDPRASATATASRTWATTSRSGPRAIPPRRSPGCSATSRRPRPAPARAPARPR